MIDSHFHLADEAFEGDLDAVVGRARAAGLTSGLCVLAAGDAGEAARAARDAGPCAFDGNIYRATGYVYFNTESFLRVITQYVTFDKRLNFYPLFSYKLNAFTVFYAGTTRDLTNFSGGTAGWTTTQTQYFVKLQYLMQS